MFRISLPFSVCLNLGASQNLGVWGEEKGLTFGQDKEEGKKWATNSTPI